MTVFVAMQSVRLTVSGRSMDLQAGEPCEMTEDEAKTVAPGLLAPSTQTETVGTEVPSENDEAPRFEKKNAKK